MPPKSLHFAVWSKAGNHPPKGSPCARRHSLRLTTSQLGTVHFVPRSDDLSIYYILLSFPVDQSQKRIGLADSASSLQMTRGALPKPGKIPNTAIAYLSLNVDAASSPSRRLCYAAIPATAAYLFVLQMSPLRPPRPRLPPLSPLPPVSPLPPLPPPTMAMPMALSAPGTTLKNRAARTQTTRHRRWRMKC